MYFLLPLLLLSLICIYLLCWRVALHLLTTLLTIKERTVIFSSVYLLMLYNHEEIYIRFTLSCVGIIVVYWSSLSVQHVTMAIDPGKKLALVAALKTVNADLTSPKSCIKEQAPGGFVASSWQLCSHSAEHTAVISLQVPHTVSSEVFSNQAFLERQQWRAQTHSLGWLRRTASARKHRTPQGCCHGERETGFSSSTCLESCCA